MLQQLLQPRSQRIDFTTKLTPPIQLSRLAGAWGGGIFLENAQSCVDRVNAMAGSALKIELLPVNSVVKTSQMQDAVHRGVLDASHGVAIDNNTWQTCIRKPPDKPIRTFLLSADTV